MGCCSDFSYNCSYPSVPEISDFDQAITTLFEGEQLSTALVDEFWNAREAVYVQREQVFERAKKIHDRTIASVGGLTLPSMALVTLGFVLNPTVISTLGTGLILSAACILCIPPAYLCFRGEVESRNYNALEIQDQNDQFREKRLKNDHRFQEICLKAKSDRAAFLQGLKA